MPGRVPKAEALLRERPPKMSLIKAYTYNMDMCIIVCGRLFGDLTLLELLSCFWLFYYDNFKNICIP